MKFEKNYNVNISGKVVHVNLKEMKAFLNRNMESLDLAFEFAGTELSAVALCSALHETKKSIIQQFKKLPEGGVITARIGNELATEETYIELEQETIFLLVPYQEFHFKKVA